MFRVISYILAVAIFTTPWFIGGNWPFCRFWLLLLGAAGLSVIFINQLLAKSGKPALDDPKIALHNVWLLLAAGCIFTAFQASGASGWLQARLGAENPAISIHQTIFESSANHLGKHPQRIDTENALGNETGDRLKNHLPQKRPISVYPAATREKLVDLIFGSRDIFYRHHRAQPCQVSATHLSGIGKLRCGGQFRRNFTTTILQRQSTLGVRTSWRRGSFRSIRKWQ